jgi:hypothetical protein
MNQRHSDHQHLEHIHQLLHDIQERLIQMALDFANLEAKVTKIDTVVDSVITLLTAIAQDIRDNAGNQTKLDALATDIDTKADALAAAAAANTPGQPPVDPNAPVASRRR